MRTTAHIFLCGVLFLTLPGCGGGGGSSGPGPSQPQSLTITPGTASLRVNQTETFTGTITLTNGQTQPVQPAWQSDNTAVLTFDGGIARGRLNGLATIIATSQGLTATRLIRVYSDYQGVWEGDYVLRRCEETGDWRGSEFCDRENGFQVGDILDIGLELRQTADAVTGDIILGTAEGTATGTIDGNGRLNGTGSITITEDGVSLAIAVNPMSFNAEGDRLTGRVTVTFTVAGASGHGQFEGELQTVVRTSTNVAALARMAESPASVRDAVRAIKQR